MTQLNKTKITHTQKYLAQEMKDAATRQEIIVEEEIRVTETEEIQIIEAEIPMMKVNGKKDEKIFEGIV